VRYFIPLLAGEGQLTRFVGPNWPRWFFPETWSAQCSMDGLRWIQARLKWAVMEGPHYTHQLILAAGPRSVMSIRVLRARWSLARTRTGSLRESLCYFAWNAIMNWSTSDASVAPPSDSRPPESIRYAVVIIGKDWSPDPGVFLKWGQRKLSLKARGYQKFLIALSLSILAFPNRWPERRVYIPSEPGSVQKSRAWRSVSRVRIGLSPTPVAFSSVSRSNAPAVGFTT
jgi:hypothetical protein